MRRFVPATFQAQRYSQLASAEDVLPVSMVSTLRRQRVGGAFITFGVYMMAAAIHFYNDGIYSNAPSDNSIPSPTASPFPSWFNASVSALPSPSELFNATVSALPSPSEILNATVSALPSPSEIFNASMNALSNPFETFNSTLSASPTPSASNNQPYFHGSAGTIFVDSAAVAVVATLFYYGLSLYTESRLEDELPCRDIRVDIIEEPLDTQLKAADIPDYSTVVGERLIFLKRSGTGQYLKVYCLADGKLRDLGLDDKISTAITDSGELQAAVLNSAGDAPGLLALTYSATQFKALVTMAVVSMLMESILNPIFRHIDSLVDHRASWAFLLANICGIFAAMYTVQFKPYLPGVERQSAPVNNFTLFDREDADKAGLELASRSTNNAKFQ